MADPDSVAQVRHALVIGVSRYADFRLDPLPSSAADVAAVAALLRNPGIGACTVTTLLDQPEHKMRQQLSRFLSRRAYDDHAILYISCHGERDPRGNLYLAATDTNKDDLPGTALDAMWLSNQLTDCHARRKVLVLDCCYAGAFPNAKGSRNLDLLSLMNTGGRGYMMLAACRESEIAYPGATVDGGAGLSAFTAGLVDGLRTGMADRDNDGLISVEEAFRHAEDYLARVGAKQTPQLSQKTSGSIALAYARRAPDIDIQSFTDARRSPGSGSRVIDEWPSLDELTESKPQVYQTRTPPPRRGSTPQRSAAPPRPAETASPIRRTVPSPRTGSPRLSLRKRSYGPRIITVVLIVSAFALGAAGVKKILNSKEPNLDAAQHVYFQNAHATCRWAQPVPSKKQSAVADTWHDCAQKIPDRSAPSVIRFTLTGLTKETWQKVQQGPANNGPYADGCHPTVENPKWHAPYDNSPNNGVSQTSTGTGVSSTLIFEYTFKKIASPDPLPVALGIICGADQRLAAEFAYMIP